MTQKQLHGLVDCLANVCTFNTSWDYSLSIQERTGFGCYDATLQVFLNVSDYSFTSSDIRQLFGLSEAWNVVLCFESLHGVPVAKFM